MKRLGTVEVPDDCPRLADGGVGPRVCGERGCREHVLKNAGATRAGGKIERLRVLSELGNDCALDVVDQHPDGMTYEQIGLYFAITRQAAETLTRRSRLKVLRSHALLRHG